MNYTVEEFDNMKTKVLKYVLYKKRTEQEIRQKFNKEDNQIIEDVIDYLKEAGYISDEEYVARAINEYIALKNLSITEIKYKLLSKGINKDLVDNYIDLHYEDMIEYELNSIKKIILKKANLLEDDELIEFLYKKGYKKDLIKQAINERYNEDE